MEDLREALRDIAEDNSASALLGRSSIFLQQFVRAYCSARKECPKAVAGECPLDAHTGGIGDVMAELDRVGQMMNAVDTHLGKAAHNADSYSPSKMRDVSVSLHTKDR